ncbi:MAG: Clp protease N-terminal domain-containing protein [Planctomycetota bacterium]
MHERFSDRARHAMALANLEATRLNHSYLAPAHLMLGLIAEGACVATEALRLLEVDLDRVRAEVQAELETPADSAPAFGRRAQTKEMKEVVAAAIAEARKFGHRYVGTEHLMLALFHLPDGVPARVLRKQGVALDKLREKTLTLLHSIVDPTHDLAHSRHGDFEWAHQQELAKAFRSPTFWHTLILAVDSANRLGAGEIEPHHLLLALLRDESNGLADLLREKGVTVEWLRQRLTPGSE